MLPPQQARDDSLRARLAQGRDAVTRASEFRACCGGSITRSEEHTSELQSDQISYAVFCLKKKKRSPLLPKGPDLAPARSAPCDPPRPTNVIVSPATLTNNPCSLTAVRTPSLRAYRCTTGCP